MSVIITPNMNLPVPVVGSEPGPQYAQDINSCMSIIDGHNHTAGYGVPITPSAINWNADLTSMNNRLLLAKSVTFTVQGTPLLGVLPDIGALYVSGVDLYYNDISGNQIQITQGGGVAGAPGSISNLTPPASASYSSANSEFIWQSASNTAAGMDNGPITIREEVANAKGITIQSPTGLAADYSLTLPGALPSQQNIVTVDNSGNISDVTWNQAANNRTRSSATTVAAGGIAISNSSGAYSVTPNAGYVDVTNLSVTITTGGSPVCIMLINDSSTSQGTLTWEVSNGNTQGVMALRIVRGSTDIYDTACNTLNNTANNDLALSIPPGAINHIDVVSAGTYTYKFQANVPTGSNGSINFVKLVAYEL